MRPINSMIEFKQIIGRGTRLYDGKDYFTIHDFVKAHHHFSDPEWDGEPVDNTTEPSDSTGGVKDVLKVSEPGPAIEAKKTKVRVKHRRLHDIRPRFR
jgi:type I restriction enzyme R subunit